MSDDPVERAWAEMRRVLIERYGIGAAADWLATSASFLRAEARKQTERNVASAENVMAFKA